MVEKKSKKPEEIGSEGTEAFLEWLKSVPDPHERYRRATDELERHQRAVEELSTLRAYAASDAYDVSGSVRELAREFGVSPTRAHQLIRDAAGESEKGIADEAAARRPPEGEDMMGTTKKSATESGTTLLVLVVDRSGSMDSIKEDMEGGIKTLIAEQVEQDGKCLVTLAQFDDVYEVVADQVPANKMPAYRLVPRGSTALLDAIGRTIATVHSQISNTRPDERPDHVIVAVITDGLENASREWSRLQVMDSVKARSGEGWQFTFLGANQDAIQKGRGIGLHPESALTFSADPDATRAAMSSLSSSVRRVRSGESQAMEYTEAERASSSRR